MSSSFYLSAAHKSSGKTLVSLGLCAALKSQSLSVQAFKKGPDYIDPIWLCKASGHPCYNLDFYNMSNEEIQSLYQQHAQNKDVVVIEGNKGLYDGMNVSGGNANADLAKLLDIPVVLVIDTNGMTRGIAPLIKGYQDFDKSIKFAGVILNKVGGQRHESKLVKAIQYYTDMEVLGSVHRSNELMIDERHLGLMPANETGGSEAMIKTIAKHINDGVDIGQLLSVSTTKSPKSSTKVTKVEKVLRIAVAKDSAFGFYYADDLDAFESLGVGIQYFDTTKDSKLPEVDGLFIGGGFPEMKLEALSKNKSLLNDIQQKITQGLPTYAECGGLMYLTNSITFNRKKYAMAGVIDADTIMTKRPVGRGYVELEAEDYHPWQGVSEKIYAHEFHYSKLENINPNTRYGYKVLRGVGVDNNQDGILFNNLLATYAHLRNVGGNRWVEQFVDFIKKKIANQ